MSLASLQTTELSDADPSAAAAPGNPELSRFKRESFAEFMVYESMANAIRSAIAQFLLPFQSTEESTYVAKTLLLDDFLIKFAGMANTFSDNCCQELVKIVRASSRIEAVRLTPTPDLARRVREATFPQLDSILANFANAARKAEIFQNNLKKQRESNSKVSAAALEPGASDAAPREDVERFHLGLSRARFQAYGKIVEFLQALPALAKPLMDYTSDKCFAADVIFELETEQIARTQAAMREKLDNALATMSKVLVTAKSELDRATAQSTMNQQDERFHVALEQLVEHRIEEKANSAARFKRAVVVVIVISGLILLGLLWIVLQQLKRP